MLVEQGFLVVRAVRLPAGPLTADLQSYPEYKQARWNFPDGDLPTTLWRLTGVAG